MICLAQHWVLFCFGLVDFGEIGPFVLRCMIYFFFIPKSFSSIFFFAYDNCHRQYSFIVYERVSPGFGLASASEPSVVYSGVRLLHSYLDFIRSFDVVC